MTCPDPVAGTATMMRLLVSNSGSYPRISAASSLEAVRQVIGDQVDCGVDLVTDGQIGWGDSAAHLAGHLTGIQLTASERSGGSGEPLLQPVVRGPFAWAVPVLRPEYEAARSISPKPVMPVLPGPLTLARHCRVIDPYYRRDYARLVSDFNEALVCEVRELSRAAAGVIQIEEPALLQEPEREELRMLSYCMRRLASAREGARLMLNPGPGDSAAMLEELFRMPADIIALDFSRNPRLADIVAYAAPKKLLALGLVNGQNPELEELGPLRRMVDTLVPALSGAECYLMPSSGMRDLPREAAMGKLKLLAELRDLVSGAGGE
jgi:5-methyltetrahydropteroyltriglutamate--homocysteine methyltransferase